jgi:hypothetical protein
MTIIMATYLTGHISPAGPIGPGYAARRDTSILARSPPERLAWPEAADVTNGTEMAHRTPGEPRHPALGRGGRMLDI